MINEQDMEKNFICLNEIDERFLALKIRSNSCTIPSIQEAALRFDFVPKLKPKKHSYLPSPMILNSKMKMIEMNRCPEKDSDISEGTEDENKSLFQIYSKKDYEKKYSIYKNSEKLNNEDSKSPSKKFEKNDTHIEIPNLSLNSEINCYNNIHEEKLLIYKNRISKKKFKIFPNDLIRGFGEFENLNGELGRVENLNYLREHNPTLYKIKKKSSVNQNYKSKPRHLNCFQNDINKFCGNKIGRRFKSSSNRTNFIFNEDIENEEDPFKCYRFLKIRKNSILNKLEINILENKRSFDMS